MQGRGITVAIAILALAGCSRHTPDDPTDARPLPTTVFEGFPLSGNLANATAAGFGGCMDGNYGLRCHKEGVKVMGVGPLSAAVDFDAAPKDAPRRFDHLTLWRAGDQSAVLDLGTALKAAGWSSCLTPDAERYWRPSSPVRIAIDTNYWSIRRVIVSAPSPSPAKYC
jgi:hypothetical protein